MIRKVLLSLSLVAAMFLVSGCGADVTKDKMKDKAKELIDKAKEQTKDLDAKAKEVADAAKESFLKPMMSLFPEIEKKIKELTGDKQTEATGKFDAVKKMIDKLKEAMPKDWEGLKEGLTKAFEELKKLVGL